MSNFIFIDTTTPETAEGLCDKVDSLGALLARIADLKTQADAIKDELRASGVISADGHVFRATVGQDSDVELVDWELVAHAGLSKKLIEKLSKKFSFTSHRVGAVRVVARKG